MPTNRQKVAMAISPEMIPFKAPQICLPRCRDVLFQELIKKTHIVRLPCQFRLIHMTDVQIATRRKQVCLRDYSLGLRAGVEGEIDGKQNCKGSQIHCDLNW